MDVFKYALQACTEYDPSNSMNHAPPESKVSVLKELNMKPEGES